MGHRNPDIDHIDHHRINRYETHRYPRTRCRTRCRCQARPNQTQLRAILPTRCGQGGGRWIDQARHRGGGWIESLALYEQRPTRVRNILAHRFFVFRVQNYEIDPPTKILFTTATGRPVVLLSQDHPSSDPARCFTLGEDRAADHPCAGRRCRRLLSPKFAGVVLGCPHSRFR